jgi:hypothetical protein
MKRRFAYLIVIAFLASPDIIRAQTFIRLTNTFINKSKKRNNQPVIFFPLGAHVADQVIRFGSDSTKQSHILEVNYVIYKKRRKAYCRKIMSYLTQDGNYKELKSKPTLFDDGLYLWLNSKIPDISNEEFIPFVRYNLFEEKMDTIGTFHAGYYLIAIYTGGTILEKLIDMNYLKKWIEHYRNLNLETNTSMTLFSFYQKLKEYLQINEHQFIFSKYELK